MNETPKNPESAPLLRFSDALGELLADARDANEARTSGTPRGPVTGLPSLDREIGHALAPGLHGIHGAPGTGKTAFTLQLAASCRFPALYVTCEMSPAELLRRHTARATETFLGRLKNGEMPVSEVEKLTRRALADAPDLALLDATRAPALPQRIHEAALVAKGESSNLLIVIDSLQSWAEGLGDATGAGEYEILNAGLKALRELAHSLKCPVLFVSERNRDSMKSGGQSAGAGTRKIEYGTETVFDLDRDMSDKEDGAGEFSIALKLVKNRHGSVGKSIPLQFNGALQRFREVPSAAKGGRR
jgi:replicative DNA helicase